MGAGHSFLVLEGPLSEDTHSLDPAPDESGGPPPDFFKPLFHNISYFYLPLFFLLTPPVFFLHIGMLIIVTMSPSLDSFLQVRLPHPELPCDVPHL